MSLDFQYSMGDRVVSSGNYDTTTGGLAAMLREMSHEPITIDGEVIGNYALIEMDRGFDTPGDRARIKRFYQQVADRHMALGKVADVTITIGSLSNTGPGLPILIQARDVATNTTESAMLPYGGLI